jgi:[NiFe] hydrogenase assembly HybE family chaperone
VSEPLRRHELDPSPLLEAAFRRIHRECMADVPIINPALEVEAVGFIQHEGHWLGVLIAPWFMNLLRVPGPLAAWTSVRGETRHFRALPSGTYAFLGSEEPEVGEFQTCSLISPMGQFADQQSARATAQAVLAMLLAPPAPGSLPDIGPPRRAGTTEVEPAIEPPEAPAPPIAPPQPRPTSKRDFLFGALRHG